MMLKSCNNSHAATRNGVTADPARRIKMLEEENDTLREQVAQLKNSFGAHNYFPPIFNFTLKEEQIFKVLLSRELVSLEQLSLFIYSNSAKDCAPNPAIFSVFICRIRKKLKEFDVEIRTSMDRGYYITPDMKARVHALIAGAIKPETQDLK